MAEFGKIKNKENTISYVLIMVEVNFYHLHHYFLSNSVSVCIATLKAPRPLGKPA